MRLAPAIEEVLLAETVRVRSAQPTTEWDEAVSQLGLSEEDIAATDLSLVNISTED